MKEKGTILIVEDRFEEKIGKFQEFLNKEGYSIKHVDTLEEADTVLDKLLKENKLDGIILDFSFPVNNEDESTNIDNIPCGVQLFKKHQFKIDTQRIPVIINTTGDEEYKRKYLGDFNKLSNPIYNVNHHANPLAQPNIEMVKEILKLFNTRNEQRIISSQAKPDNRWLSTGRTGVYNSTTKKYTYLRDGD